MARQTLIFITLAVLSLVSTVVVILMLTLRNPAPVMPPLIRDLPSETPANSTEFQRRLRERFPDHAPEADLIAELNSQGFQILPEAGLAHFTWPAPPCTESWQVLWSAESGRLINVSGRRARVCQ